MNKIIFIFFLFFSIYFSNSQPDYKFENKENLITYLDEKLCKQPFSIQIKNSTDYNLELIKNKGNLFFKFSNNSYNNIIKSNGEIILNINHRLLYIFFPPLFFLILALI